MPIDEYKPKKVVQVGNSHALIIPPAWREQLLEQNAYGIWKVIYDEQGNQLRIEVRFVDEGLAEDIKQKQY